MGLRKTKNGNFQIEMDRNGAYTVQGPDGRIYRFDSPAQAREMMEHYMDYSYPKYNNSYDDFVCEEHYEEKNKELKQLTAYQEATIKELQQANKITIANGKQYSQVPNPAIAKIQEEIDRVEAQIAKSQDEENKAKMTVYVAGMVKALKLLKGE